MVRRTEVLLVNPWIYDFAAYNLWVEPLGLLTIAAALRDCGYGVTVLDCLAPHPAAPRPRADGSGKYLKTHVDRPPPVAFVPRRFGRYGLPAQRFDAALLDAPGPDLVLISSGMTFWYPGVAATIERVRARWGTVTVALGGVYATLCTDHARQHSGADRVIAGPGVVAALCLADEIAGRDCGSDRYANPSSWPEPAHDLVSRPYAGLITSWGCPYRCTYCASHHLQADFVQREPAAISAEIAACVRRGIHDFAFLDDALLVDAGTHLVPVLEGVIAQGLQVRFHTPNGVHARQITPALAGLMRRAGFATVRIALETVDPVRQRITGGKVTTEDFVRAVGHLRAAGFQPRELAAYVLAGLPDQPLSEVEAAIRFVHRLGLQAKLSLFSPIPGTTEGDRALPPGADPLLHNNTVYPYLLGPAYAAGLQRLKHLAKGGNAALAAGLPVPVDLATSEIVC